MKKIRTGDQVIVITGRDKGKKGTVSAMLGDKILVDGVNQYKKNVKPNPATGVTGGVIDKTMPIQISNVALVDADGKPSRVGIKEVDGKKVRFLKTTGATLTA
jgi:large subunit ribosomal protein L24